MCAEKEKKEREGERDRVCVFVLEREKQNFEGERRGDRGGFSTSNLSFLFPSVGAR